MRIDQEFPYYSIGAAEALEKLSSEESGLSNKAVKQRQEEYGKNVLPEKGGTSVIALFLKQFKDFLILILFIAAGIAFWADQMADVYIILAVILFNAIMGFVQEYRAEKAIESIKSLVKKKAYVLREGRQKQVEAAEVVPGDIIVLKEGATIPADGRLIKSKDLHTTEASLTGESMPIEKNTKEAEEELPLGDRCNSVFKATHVSRGTGRAVVTATGKYTEIGKIASSMSEMQMQDSNFKKKTAKLGKKMAAIAIVTASLVFLIGYFYRDFGFQNILLVTIASLVSSIPEGLPVVISIVLAIGANRMAKKNAIIREFTATEMMGSVSTILSDKTGTITQSILTVKKVFSGSGRHLYVGGSGYNLEGDFTSEDEKVDLFSDPVESKLMVIGQFCNDASVEMPENDREGESDKQDPQEVEVSGDPTEVAMLVMGRKAKTLDQHRYKKYSVIDDLPFNSEQKFRASLVQKGDEKDQELFVIGAPEKILELCTHFLTADGPQEMTSGKRKEIEEKINEWTGEAMRVLSQAYRPANALYEARVEDVKDLTWVGITGIIDPPRDGVKESIEQCKTAGIRVVMVTGDHKRTAAAIAQQVGIIDKLENEEGSPYPVSLTSEDLDTDDEKFDELIENVNVFARVDPQTKLRIAERLQKKDTLVAMTGDGVNDAPALKRADVGIAMGQRGTDVARDAAAIVLQDDNFSSIVNAVREGRIVFENVKKTSYFLLTTNFAQVAVIITALLLGLPIPLTAAMILFVNLVTDGVMDVALATEPGHGNIMHEPPVKKSANILSLDIVPFLATMAVIMVTLAVLTFNYFLPQGEAYARTGAFLVVALTQIFNAYNMRSLQESIFKIGVFTNNWINLAFLVSVVLQVGVIKIPFFRDMFGFADIGSLSMLVLFFLSSLVLWGGEIYKLIRARTL